MIDVAILGLLDEHELHGYELRKRLGELLGTRLAVSFGSLYPALNRLERAGYVKAVSDRHVAEAPRSPMSGSLTGELAAFGARRRASAGSRVAGRGRGRAKKVYGVTNAGRRHLVELITDPDVSDDRSFAVRVAFCQHVPPAGRLVLFEARRAELIRRRDERRAAGTRRQLNHYLHSLVERDTRALYADIEWLDGLIAAERSGAAPPDAAPPGAAPPDAAPPDAAPPGGEPAGIGPAGLAPPDLVPDPDPGAAAAAGGPGPSQAPTPTATGAGAPTDLGGQP